MAASSGAMLDAHSLNVSYDSQRGEPRGARSRQTDAAQLGPGSCVDCTLCVQVCPVGIDIRQGLQAACINCGACVDACAWPSVVCRVCSCWGQQDPSR